MKISCNFRKVHFIQKVNEKTTFKQVCQLWNKTFPKVDSYIKRKVSLTATSWHSGTLDPKILQKVIRNFTFSHRHLVNHKTLMMSSLDDLSDKRKLPIKSSFQVKTRKPMHHMKEELKTVVDNAGSHAYEQI